MDSKRYEELKKLVWQLKSDGRRPTLPFHVLAGEAIDMVRFARRNWEPVESDSGELRPGLKSAVGNRTFSEDAADELKELVEAMQRAQTDYHLVSRAKVVPVERAKFVLSELRTTMQWCFDDGEEAETDAQLARLMSAHADARSHDAIAAALYDFAELAHRVRDQIAGMGGFDTALIEEARELGDSLRLHSAGPETRTKEPSEVIALELRNRFMTLVHERTNRIRAAARFVFRRHPKILEEVVSPYFRRKRVARKKLQDNTKDSPSVANDNVKKDGSAA